MNVSPIPNSRAGDWMRDRLNRIDAQDVDVLVLSGESARLLAGILDAADAVAETTYDANGRLVGLQAGASISELRARLDRFTSSRESIPAAKQEV